MAKAQTHISLLQMPTTLFPFVLSLSFVLYYTNALRIQAKPFSIYCSLILCFPLFLSTISFLSTTHLNTHQYVFANISQHPFYWSLSLRLPILTLSFFSCHYPILQLLFIFIVCFIYTSFNGVTFSIRLSSLSRTHTKYLYNI